MHCQEETPSKSNNRLKNRVLQSSTNYDSPYTTMPKISTPPSRFMKILNPFEQHLIDRLHLPTFSPNVFAQAQQSKTDKFKWSIDDISNIKPADIDESSIKQHVTELDPTVDSMAQEKIDKYFSEKIVVPSPSPVRVLPSFMPKIIETNTCSTQTCLSLPPTLPKHIEDLLKPYFLTDSNDTDELNCNSSLYRKLFAHDEDVDCHEINSVESSPAPSMGLSPIELSPVFTGHSTHGRHSGSPLMDVLKDCPLSPVLEKADLGQHMSVDVPDIQSQLNYTDCDEANGTVPMQSIVSNDSAHWEVEYKHVSILSNSPQEEVADLLNNSTNTPHSKLFTSQRKRLSDSFKDHEVYGRDVEMDMDQKKFKNWSLERNATDGGYHTGEGSSTWNSIHVFASTPTKQKLSDCN